MLLSSFKLLGAGVAAFTLAGPDIGIGAVFTTLIIGTSRNPSVKLQLFSYSILAFALVEAIALFALMMAFLIIFS